MIDWLRADRNEPSIEIDGRLVPIALRRHTRARRLTMRVASDGSEVRITLPSWGRTLDALTFAKARRDWIARQLRDASPAITVRDGATIPYRGKTFSVCHEPSARRQPVIEGERLMVGGPSEGLEPRIRRWLENEALYLLRDDLAFYCSRAELPMPELRLSRARRRWGSCSGERDDGRCIRINWRLVMAPDSVRRSVVAHEVAHLTHFDHSAAFHARLRDVFDDDLGACDAWLKTKGRSLYGYFA
ncbi:M48 family metallopeptidase [Aurantiacibacter spongiae]|uniref:DUF45 domain-containing protein n=1 Tax=Aurantiacibacter spongiae TaxID=2488860 RepID=A0A3N5D8Q0_9SPHN|nr:YgjP-like metallopeptidase domain-containing protein [Aurantiacibacter spongiae]RPF71008.1 DUF45 domain-containing protein [Aurantiacibacter spongiae]